MRFFRRAGSRASYASLAAACVISFHSIALDLCARPVYAQDSPFDSKKIVPFVPSPQEVVDKMIELAGVGKNDTVYDLGSGDGRIVIAAAKKGARTVGFEIDPELVQ
jgi:DNA modification methylase